MATFSLDLIHRALVCIVSATVNTVRECETVWQPGIEILELLGDGWAGSSSEKVWLREIV